MTTEPGTTGRSGPAPQATERQTPGPAAALDSRPYMPAAEHRRRAEDLLELWRGGTSGHVLAMEMLAAATVHAELAKLPDPKVREAAEQFDMLGAARRVQQFTANLRAMQDHRVRALAALDKADPFRDSALDDAREALVSALDPEEDGRAELAAFEAAIRIDQREKDAGLVEGEAWPHERPERENQELYRLAQMIRDSGGAA